MRSFIALSVLVACGGGAAAPDLRRSQSLDCVIGKVHEEPFLVEKIAGDGSPAALHALGLAFLDRGREDLPYAAQLANVLAEHGARADARGLLEQPALTALAALPDDVDVDMGLMFREVQLRAGLSAQVGGERALHEIRAEAEGGDVAGAQKNLAAVDVDHATRWELPLYVAALTAVGRDDDARAALATAPVETRLAAATARLRAALVTNGKIADAVTDVLAARPGADHTTDAIAVRELDDLARATGHAADLMPYRAAVAADLHDPELALVLADVADATGDAGLRKLVDPALDRIPPDDYRRREVTAIDALYGDTLDAALAAIENIGVDEPVLWLRLWLRHASRGLDPGFETRMIDACRAS